MAISGNGVDWIRGSDRITGDKGEGAASDVGMIIEPNKDWWTFDTCHLQVSDVQVGGAWKYSLGSAGRAHGYTVSDVHDEGGRDEVVVLNPGLQVV